MCNAALWVLASNKAQHVEAIKILLEEGVDALSRVDNPEPETDYFYELKDDKNRTILMAIIE